jgi:uncharacterized surface protein with fasciclin (FAS1) repeats
MKNKITSNKKMQLIRMLLAPVALAAILVSCEIQPDYEYEYGNPGGKINMTAWEFIQTTDSLSLMEEAIIATGLQSFYSGTTVRTYILPRNSAFRAYMKTNSFPNIQAIPVAALETVIKYHIVNAKVIFTDPELLPSNNPIAYPTESGLVMYLSHNTSYQGVINQGTKKSWTIITSNIEPTNGVIHVTADVVFLSI